MLEFVPLSASTSALSMPVLALSALPSLCLWLYLGCPLLCLCPLCAWAYFSIYVCFCYVSMLVPGLSAPLFASAMSLALPKVLKKELINVVFLDLLANHVQSASSFRSIARSIVRPIARPIAHFIARPIAFPKICDLYRVPGLDARISGVKCKKSYDNIPSRYNLDTRAAIYIVWRCLVLGLRHREHNDAWCLCRRLDCSKNQIAPCLGKVRGRNL